MTLVPAKILAQDFLREGGTLEQLQARYHLLVKRDPEFPNLVMLKYHMIESPMGEPLVQQCRGLILDEAKNWDTVAYPFDKFFNYGEGHAAKIDWSFASVLEKLDGSLMILYHYAGAWRVASSGTPNAGGEVNGCGVTFRELFWRVWEEKGYKLPPDADIGMTFMFELMTPYNRVVVRHEQNDLKLIGARASFSGTEFPARWWDHRWDVVQSFELGSFEQLEQTFKNLDPLEHEGYVVVDHMYRRVKVKHPGYVAIHHMRDGFGPKRILEVIRTSESPELLTYFPEWTEAFNKIKAIYDELVESLEASYQAATAATEAAVPPGVSVSKAWLQKEFASHAVKARVSAPLFLLRAGKTSSIKQALAEMQIKSLMEILNIKDIEL